MVKVSKKYNRDFTVIQNSFFKFNEKLPKEDKLGFKEAGIFWYLWHLPNDWEFHESEIINHFKDKIDSFRTGRQKLEKYGFIKKIRNRNKQGQVGAYEWTLDDDPPFPPSLDFPTQVKPTLEKPTQENPHVQNINSTKDVSNKVFNSSSETSENPYELYRQMTGFTLTGLQQPKMMDFIKTDGTELVVSALKTAEYIAKQSDSKPSYNLFDRVMHEWESKGIKTVEQAREYEKQRLRDKQERINKSKQAYYGHQTIDRKIPESMKEEYDPEKDKLSDKDKASLEKDLEEFYKRAEE